MPNLAETYHQFESYEWTNDVEFQTGLGSILQSSSSADQTERLTTRAKCFYFSRKFGIKVVPEEYLRWKQRNITTPSQDVHECVVDLIKHDEINPPLPISFAEICKMINDGTPILGIKQIPNTILEGKGSVSHVKTRRKPWEKDDEVTTTTTV